MEKDDVWLSSIGSSKTISFFFVYLFYFVNHFFCSHITVQSRSQNDNTSFYHI